MVVWEHMPGDHVVIINTYCVDLDCLSNYLYRRLAIAASLILVKRLAQVSHYW